MSKEALEGYDELLAIMIELNEGLPDQLEIWMEKIGQFFLTEIRREIRTRKLMDTRNMLWSFQKDNENNIWETSADKNGLTLNVGSSVDYALYIEMGYVMRNGTIVYPKPYYTTALRTTEKVFMKMAENAFDAWVNRHMKGR